MITQVRRGETTTGFMRLKANVSAQRSMQSCVEKLQSDACEADERLRTGGFLLTYHVWQGDLQKSAQLLRIVAPPPHDGNIAPLSLILWKLHEARYRWSTDSAAAALTLLDEAFAITMESGVHTMDQYLHAQRAYAALAAKRIEMAEASLWDMKSLLVPGQLMDKGLFNCLSSGACLLKGDFAASLEYGVTGLAAAKACGMPVGMALCHLALAQVLICREQFAAAAAHLAETLKIAHRIRSTLFEHAALMLSAYCLLQAGDEPSALTPLARGLSIGREKRYRFIYPWSRPEVLQRLLALALQSGTEADYVRGFVRQQHLLPESPELEVWPWDVRVHTFGGLTVVINDEPLHFHGKVQRKPLELLQAVLAQAGPPVDKNTLIDQLWPDLDGDAGQNAFELALHRLRKLLGRDDAISMQAGRLTLDARRIWVDTSAFERLCTKVEHRSFLHAGNTDPASIGDALMRYYQGHFLEGEEARWAITARERFRNKFVRTITSIGQELERSGRWEDLVTLYRRAIEIDPLIEELHQHLILAFREQGRIAEALDAYRHCRALMSITLGIESSGTTQALYRSLTHG
jgi:DNA-binding SARP family transcriptional activator